MKAAILREPGKPLSIEQVDIGTPGSREILITTKAVGLCRSDLHFLDGTFPHPVPTIPGHEACGVVEAVGNDVHGFVPGDHVVTFLRPFCGTCELCMTGKHSLCTDSSVQRDADGPQRLSQNGETINQFLNLSALAEKMLVHENACVRVSKDIPFDRAALIGCGVITGASSIFNDCHLEPGEKVAIVGAGGIGLSAINAAKIAGAGEIIAIDMVPEKLDVAKSFGATKTFKADQEELAQAVIEATGGGVHYAIEAVGRTDTAELCWSILRPGGTATILGMIGPMKMINIHGPELLAGKKLQGSIMGGARFKVDMPRLVDFYLKGQLDLDSLIDQRIPLEQVNEGFDVMRAGGDALRSVVIFE